MKPPLRVLIIDDSPDDAELIARELQREFDPIIDRVETPEEMKSALGSENWDVVISDYVMPQFSGLSALKSLQQLNIDLPFIMVSGQMGEEVAVEAMRAGARDYLIKDNLTRLIPAIKRELKEAFVRNERRKAEEALHATEARFQSLVEQSLVGIYLLQDGIFSYVNPKFAKIFGYQQNELIESRTLSDLVAENDRNKVIDSYLNLLGENAQSLHCYFQGKRKYAKIIDLEAHGAKTELNGKPAVIGTLLDITERKRAEEELRKLWRAVEQSPVSVVITDTDGNIEYVNPKFTAVSGYNEQELLGKNPRILQAGTMKPDEYKQMWETITAGKEWHGEYHNKKKNGELFWESASISAIKNTEGQITHYVGVKEDITERKKSIEQLRQAQKMEAIGQLAGGIAHDFNNLLTIINGYSTLLLRSLDNDSPQHKEAEQILRAGERAADLTRQLLSFSRKQILAPKVLNINTQVKTIEKMLCRLIGEHITLVTNLDQDVGLIKIDPGQVEQIIMNLVVNARDASEDGGRIVIETANAELDDEFAATHPGSVPGSYIMLSVCDNGMGMTEDVKRRLFEPFFTTKELGRGTGLGLATVYGIVKQSGGYIDVTSELEQGATFKIFLPRIHQQMDTATKPSTEEAPQGSQTILVVEDEPGVLNLVVHTLNKQGYNVLETTDPLEAVEIFDQHQSEIDLVLTDVVMPFMSGPKLAETLTQKKPGIKIIFMSGHTDDKVNFEKILEKGVPFLAKPFVNGSLVKKVGHALGNDAIRAETVKA